jgi:hypothetical protein
MATRVTNLTTKRTTTMITGASIGNDKATTRVGESTEREKAETITTRTGAVITETIMRKNQEMITGGKRNNLSKRRKIVVIIDEMYGRIFLERLRIFVRKDWDLNFFKN